MVSDGSLGCLKIAWAGPQKLCVLGETPLAVGDVGPEVARGPAAADDEEEEEAEEDDKAS